MKRSFNKMALVPLAALVLAGFVFSPVAEAAGGARAGGSGGGGGARASAGGGGGGARAGGGTAPQARASGAAGGGARQVDSTKADARTNNVRSSSANSVNSSRNTNVSNVNVNVNNGNNGGWDNDYHPVAGAMVVGATAAVIGSMVRTPPPGCVPVSYSGMVYQQCGATWYQPQGSQYVVVNPPY
jgi:hypothetical protein